MKTTFPEKSQSFEKAIRKISDIIVNAAKDKIAFIILFGSFARGTWVRDRYSEDNAVYEYFSDYDFLVITKTGNQANNNFSFDLDRIFEKHGLIGKYQSHNPHCIVESINYVNSELEKGRYFFSDIKKEGIVLYDSGEFKLSEPRVLSEKEIKEIAQEDYEHWFGRAEDFLLKFKTLFEAVRFDSAAFDLHQATESLYNCALLVLTGYKPKSHDLFQLGKLAAAQSNQFLAIFPTATEEQKECFKLLKKAYINARYNKNFKITKNQLEYLIERIGILRDVVRKICESKI